MKKQYCEYCGAHLDDGCECARIIEEDRLQFIEDYENDLAVQVGWAFHDKLDIMRFER